MVTTVAAAIVWRPRSAPLLLEALDGAVLKALLLIDRRQLVFHRGEAIKLAQDGLHDFLDGVLVAFLRFLAAVVGGHGASGNESLDRSESHNKQPALKQHQTITMEMHQVPTIVPFFPDEDGGLYGPSSPAPLLGGTAAFTGDAASASTGFGLFGADGEATATDLGADAAARLGAMADAAAALRAAAVADANAELNTAAARTGFCPSNAAACAGFRAHAARSPTPAAATASSTGCSAGDTTASAGADTGSLLRRAGSLASRQCSARPSNTWYGSSTAFAAPAAARYTNSAYPRNRPVPASKQNGP
ncbi:hypothetical protein EJB05_26891, partial [Eragrostis curvula]